MAGKKKIALVLLAATMLGAGFYFTRLGGIIGQTVSSWSIKLARVEKEIMYSAQALQFFGVKPDVSLDVPFHKQEHALSCEIATLKMALNYHGQLVAESELLNDLAFDTTAPRSPDNVWGDPDKGFVGNIDGKIPNIGYGVYEDPIVNLALRYRDAKKLENATLYDILTEAANGNPVIVWGFLASGKDISWRTKEGKYVKAVFGEHTRVVTGFSGTPSNPKVITLLDPIYGKIRMSAQGFEANWARLGHKAVVIY
ncbi:MAG: C39 family peptidase [Parcubacteria group bacterium]|nr:C39 family peptidase [Parcubacteria group bacterium]